MRIGLGCMRLSTDPDRDEQRALATLRAALDAGITTLDTARAYGCDEADLGHNERLIARALATRPDAPRPRVIRATSLLVSATAAGGVARVRAPPRRRGA